MRTLNIQTDNINIIQAIQALVKLDSTTIITYDDEPRHLSKEDEDRLQKTYDSVKSGKMKYHSKADIIKSTNETLRKFGANV